MDNVEIVEIRATHPYGFRSGQWALLFAVQWFNDRPCYHVIFPDGFTDHWPVNDPADPYEFRPHRPKETT